MTGNDYEGLLKRCLDAGFEKCSPYDDTAQFTVFGAWYRPKLGCDSLQASIEEIRDWCVETRDVLTDPNTDFVAFLNRQFGYTE